VDPGVAVHYTAIEPNQALLAAARRRLSPAPFASMTFANADLATFAESEEHALRFDLVIAHAVLDILDLRSSLTSLVRLTHPEGLLYLPITFDGETSFEPAREEDALVLAAYHETMEEKGSSRTGRRLFHELRSHPVDVLELGSSDWIVHPVGRAYPHEDAFFLEFIVRTVVSAVRGRVDATLLDRWAEARLRHVEDGELVYLAHQIDLLARRRA
jgi:hypothetical protein